MARGLQREGGREAFWRDALDRQRQSGLNVRQWCRREQVPESAFYFWRRQIVQRSADPARVDRPAFLPVTLALPMPEHPIVIRLRGGRVMRLAAAMDPRRVAELVHAIESQPARSQGAAS